jgi:L-threonylcarbamoyladenylate synthase
MTTKIASPTPAVLATAARRLREGHLVAFPTETVYGLGADAANPQAVHAIFAAKGRPTDHPVIVHLPGVEHVARWVRAFPAGARKLAAEFWPGPLTLILPRAPHVPDAVTGGQDSVGLRVPSHRIARELLAAFGAAGGEGIAAPSANRFGGVSPTTAQHVADDLEDRVDMIIDGGACAVGIESTILAFDGDDAVLLRPGGISIDDLARVLGATPREPDGSAPRAPGTLASHYAPGTPSRLIDANTLLQVAAGNARVAILARSVARPAGFAGVWIAASDDVARYAHDLYANLRQLDAARADAILIEVPPAGDAWLAVRDRLTRATT